VEGRCHGDARVRRRQLGHEPLVPGEVGGVATNSRGDIFVYTRTGHPTLSLGTARPFAHGGSRMFHFDKTGKYLGEVGQGVYGFLYAEKVKIDPQDNIWIVDQMAGMVMEFDATGREVMLLGRKAEAENVPPRGAAPPAAPAATQQDVPCPNCHHAADRSPAPSLFNRAGGVGTGPSGQMTDADRQRLLQWIQSE